MEPIHLVQINTIGEHQPRYDKSLPCKAIWQIYRDKRTSEEGLFIQPLKAPIFVKVVLAVETMQSPNTIYKRKTIPALQQMIFHQGQFHAQFGSIAPQLAESSNETNCVFLPLKLKSLFLPQCTVPHMSGSSSEANSSCYHKSNVA